jgi:hypothetical protein
MSILRLVFDTAAVRCPQLRIGQKLRIVWFVKFVRIRKIRA